MRTVYVYDTLVSAIEIPDNEPDDFAVDIYLEMSENERMDVSTGEGNIYASAKENDFGV